MPTRPDLILAHRFPEIRHAYTARDAILYALGAGLGRDPVAPDDLAFLWEECLEVLPTFAVTLSSPGLWLRTPEFGIDFGKLVHAEQAATFHAPLPAAAETVGSARVALLADRGAGRGAVVALEREIRDAASDTLYCALRQTLFLRGDGGFGGPPAPNPPSIVPERQPDMRADFTVDSRAGLIYRLSGDPNPLHIDPEAARRGGFDRPILHGLASYAIAGIAVSRACGVSPTGVAGLQCRFSGVVFPGDRLEFRIWRRDAAAVFQGFVGERKVLDQGLATFRNKA
jgi:acyl dehydratase